MLPQNGWVKMDNPNQSHFRWMIWKYPHCRKPPRHSGIGQGALPGRFPTMPPVLVPHATSPAAFKATAPTVSPGTLQGTDGEKTEEKKGQHPGSSKGKK